MKTFFLEKLEIINFKGARNVTIEFTDKTNILGENKTGKTTIADALYFLFFGKNSEDQSTFQHKTVDEKGCVIHHLDHSVKGFFKINGTTEVFERIIKEQWEKIRGKTETMYVGDKTILKINAAPKKVNEFNTEVEHIISNHMFKLLSNPLYFNRLKWEDRRKTLIDMIGIVTNEMVLEHINDNKKYSNIVGLVEKRKSLQNRKNELRGQITELKIELEHLPERISEVEYGKPEVLKWNVLEAQINTKIKRIEQIDVLLQSKAKKHEQMSQNQNKTALLISKKQRELQNVESELNLAANETIIKNKIAVQKLNAKLSDCNLIIETNNTEIKKIESEIGQNKAERESLLKQWKEIKSITFKFDESKLVCPTCKQSLPEDEIEQTRSELEGNFNETKANDLQKNNKKGLAVKSSTEESLTKIAELKEAVESAVNLNDEYQKEIDALDITEKPVDYSMEKEWNDLHSEIDELMLKNKAEKLPKNTELNQEKQTLQSETKPIQKQLDSRELIEKANLRIKELYKKQNNLAQNISYLELQEDEIMEFEKVKMNLLEEKVNSKFTMVKFRMFEPQKNGGEKSDCVTLIDGVPFNDANTASKINAGLDIINVISQHYQLFVPVIIDNRESVTEILPIKSQVINLIKDYNYKTLTVQ